MNAFEYGRAAALARGEHLVEVACTSCHGEDLSGAVMFEEPGIGRVSGTNITGLGEGRSVEDLVRAIRHGVGMEGRQLLLMPSQELVRFSAEDLGAIIAYVRTVPRVEHKVRAEELTALGRILLGAGQFGNVFAAAAMDHAEPFYPMPPVGANVEYGKYLGRFCTSCHGPDLAGGLSPFDPASPPAPNLTPAERLSIYSEADFLRVMRTGVTPYGQELDPEFMPWESIGKFDDEELLGLFMYLQALPPTPTPVN